MPAKATGCNAVLVRENGFGETADAEGFNEFLDLEGGAAGSGDGNLHTESYLPEQTAVDGLGRTDTFKVGYSNFAEVAPEHRCWRGSLYDLGGF